MWKKMQEKVKKILVRIRKERKTWSILKFALLSLAGGLILVTSAFHFAYRGRIYPGVIVAGQPVGNRTKTEAAKAISQRVSISQPKLVLTSENQKWLIDLNEVEFDYDSQASAEKAYSVGREGNLIQTFRAKVLAWFKGVDVDLEYHLNSDLFQDQITTIAAEILAPAIQPTIKIINQEIVIEPGKSDQELDQKGLASQLHHSLASYNFQPLKLTITQLSSVPNEEEIKKTRARAEKLITKKLTFALENNQWELTDEELVNFLCFEDGFNQEKIASQAASLASTINRPAQNAFFQFEAGKVTEFRAALDGWKLNEAETNNLIKEGLARLEKGEEVETLLLPIKVTSPTITIDQVNDLGIKELLGRGVSYFWGSIPSRIHNIVLASSNLNGILLAPGETFSLNQTLGDVSPATGYQSAFIIKEGKTILGDGGGVCQVSTTLFRAALNTGLPILERHPHSYRVSYYEQGGFGPGLDATVWIPRVDLKFKNDTPGHLLIQALADTKTKTLIFEFYGTNDGRKVSLSKPRIWDQTPPPPDLYQDDPSLPSGTIKQIERANWGAKVAVDWRVTRGDEILQEKAFYSSYQPWQAVYLRGTGQ